MNRGVEENLYEQVAERLSGQVRSGVYQAGDRVPSVRNLSSQLKVSISTVIEAYRLLEARGVLEARPQSGYYVRARLWQAPAEPAMSRPATQPTTVGVSQLAMQVLHASSEPDVMPLGVAVPHASFLPLRALDRIVAAAARCDRGEAARYEFPPGNAALRAQIARRMAEVGCDVSPEDILVTSGCQEALSLALRAVARPGDTVAIESPAFYGTLQTIESLGMKALEIPTHPREGVSLEALKLALEQWTVKACVLVPSFSNPLGACMPEDRRRRLLRLLGEHGIPLIEDDIYGDLGFGSERPKPVKAFDRKGLVFYCASFSKTLAPGLRVGWIAPPARYREPLWHLKYVSSMATATIPQLAVAEFLARGGYERHLRRVRTQYARLAVQMTQAIARHFPSGTRVTQPAGGFVLWVELPERVDALELHRRALAKKISVAPGPLFSAKQKYRHFVRLTCALPWDERLEHALATLGRLAEELA
jgi:DNA-binding transcriptional MocR family regulator